MAADTSQGFGCEPRLTLLLATVEGAQDAIVIAPNEISGAMRFAY